MNLQLQTQQKSSGELAATASAALAKATIEAKFAIALHKPRSINDARIRILDACKRRGFAETARYRIPRGGTHVEGFTIRFAETVVQALGNVDVSACVAYEDDTKRMVRISVTDLETNTSYTDEVVLNKTIERSTVKPGQDVLGERQNSEGKKVFIIAATEDELLLKVNSAKSKSIRTSGLRLVPQDILDEAWDICQSTLAGEDKDPTQATKRLCDAFAACGVPPAELEKYLGHSLQSVTPKEIKSLREMWTAIKDGESTWADFTKAKDDDTIDMSAPKSSNNSESPKSSNAPTEEAKRSTFPGSQPTQESKPSVARVDTTKTSTVLDVKPVSPRETIAKVLNETGVTFDQFVTWAKDSGNLDDKLEPADLSEIPEAVAVKLAGIERALKRSLTVVKGGAK